jgi:hypothetical protein
LYERREEEEKIKIRPNNRKRTISSAVARKRAAELDFVSAGSASTVSRESFANRELSYRLPALQEKYVGVFLGTR